MFATQTRTARFTAEQAREIGSCAVIAIANVTGLTWEQVWEVAQYYFTRHGLNSGHEHGILRELGYSANGFYKLMHFDRIRTFGDKRNPMMTITEAERWLNDNMPDVRIIASINVDGMAHAISYRDGKFHNTLGAKKARIRLASIIVKA